MEEGQPHRKKKKKKLQFEDAAVDAAEAEQEVADEAPLKKKSKKRLRDEDDAAEAEHAAAEEAPLKKKKKKVQVEDESARAGHEAAEEAPLKKKKKKNRAEEAADTGEADEQVAPSKKFKRRADGTTAAGENGSEDFEGLDDREGKSKKHKKRQEEAVSQPEAAAGELPPVKKVRGGRNKRPARGDDEAMPAAASETAEPPAASSEQGFQVFVGGIPWSCSEETFRRDFAECGEVTAVRLCMNRDTGLPKGIGFVTYKTEAGQLAALEFDGTDYGGRKLRVTKAEQKGASGKGGGKGPDDHEVFLRGLPPETQEAVLRKDFLECGKIIRLNMPTNEDGQCKGFAWITFKGLSGVEKALAFNGDDYGGRTLTVEKSGLHLAGSDGKSKGKGKGHGGGGKGREASDLEIFVKNLPFEATDATLRARFAGCGEIARLNMPTKGPERKSMGFAWITFKTKASMDKALAMSDEDYEGRRLFIEQAGQHRGKG